MVVSAGGADSSGPDLYCEWTWRWPRLRSRVHNLKSSLFLGSLEPYLRGCAPFQIDNNNIFTICRETIGNAWFARRQNLN